MSCPNQNSNSLFEIIKWATPVLLFFLGLAFNKLTEKLRENNRLGKIEAYVYELLSSLDLKITQELDIINECIIKTKNWESSDIILNQSASRVIERLLELNQDDLFAIFVLRKKGNNDKNIQDYKNLMNQIDFFYLTFIQILNANKNATQNLNNAIDKWNVTSEKITYFHNTLVANRPNKDTSNFIDQFSLIQTDFNINFGVTNNIELGYEKLIKPLIQCCKKNTDNNNSAILMTYTENCKLAYYELKQIRDLHSKYLKNAQNELKKSQTKIHLLLIDMKKKKNNVA